jgi:hypothetical protein
MHSGEDAIDPVTYGLWRDVGLAGPLLQCSIPGPVNH